MKRRRLPHLLLNTATLVSLALCLATLLLWLRSHWVTDELLHVRADAHAPSTRHMLGLLSNRGVLTLRRWRNVTDYGWDLGWTRRADQWTYRYVDQTWTWAGFGYASAGPDVSALAFPHAFLALLLTTPIIPFAANRIRRRRNPTPGLCPTCGYDLRATPDRCPECGTAVK